uniref:uncharacterized protein LOC122597021 n=1 Tax=Erigeron canadensis TaxID=72917 RepID=UPI001CB8B40D|nr:uncharacterized protein LOC122597021 [Erigeron canadensis]
MVLGHKVSKVGLKVDKAKIDVIAQLPPPTNIKAIRSFLGHAGFYRRFIKDFSKIARPMTKLLEKDRPFDFDSECTKAFEILKDRLTNAPIMVAPNWSLPFELMCDASDFALGAVLGQREEKRFRPIYYASRTLNGAQQNYTTTEKELLAVVFAFDKFRAYLVLSKTVVFTDHPALKYLFTKQDAKPRLIRWILLLQEFDIEIKDKKGAENLAADHLSRLENPNLKELKEEEINDSFPNEYLMFIKNEKNDESLWFADIANYLAGGVLPICLTQTRKILDECHYGPAGGHYGPNITAIDYISKWAEAKALPTNNAKVVIDFPKNLFSRFGCPKALISDRGSHFANVQLEKVLQKYGVNHRFSTSYHPQTSGQVENTNRALKGILEKTVNSNPKNWASKLDDALWAFRTAYMTPIGTTPYRLLYGKTCHLPIEIEHKAYWALKNCNTDLIQAGEKRFLQLHELDEMRWYAYENSQLYKERTKVWHDRRIRIKEFKEGVKVLLFQSKYKFKQPKLTSQWSGPYVVKRGLPSGYIELVGNENNTFIVNGQRVKHYHEEEVEDIVEVTDGFYAIGE